MNIYKTRVKASAPGSIANLGVLFDLGALAIGDKRDLVVVERVNKRDITVISKGFDVPSGKENIAYIVAMEFLNRVGINGEGVKIVVHKGVDVGIGLGSSGATAIATAVALNELFNSNLSTEELIAIAGEGERAIAGSLHYDNVSASMLGGLVIILSKEPLKVVKYSFPKELLIVLITPKKVKISVRKTEFFRKILPKEISLEQHVDEKAHVVRFMKALYEEDIEELGKAICEGGIVERERSKYIPHYWEIKEKALRCGALGFNISGAGPSMFALVRKGEEEAFIKRLCSDFMMLRLEYDIKILHPTNNGALIVEEK
ncbi:MAG: homoserine kinase [Thermoprotei archaeon]|nr:homoserine kinase [Thermoprotei archaeon]